MFVLQDNSYCCYPGCTAQPTHGAISKLDRTPDGTSYTEGCADHMADLTNEDDYIERLRRVNDLSK